MGSSTIYQQQADSSFAPYSSAYIGSGYFERTVPDGVYKFEYEAVGSSGPSSTRTSRAWPTADPVTVGGGATALAAWTVERPYVVGTVTDASGRPIHDTQVSAYDATSGSRSPTDYTDEKGAFVLPVGVGPVKIYASGYGDYAGEWYTDKGSFETADAVTGTAGGTPLAIALGRAARSAAVVTSDAGVPLEQVRVSADGRSDVTDKTGAYVIEGVDAGTTSCASPTTSASTSRSTTRTRSRRRPRRPSRSARTRPSVASTRASRSARRSRRARSS